MISKIVCPTDFSKTAQNAIEYAAHLAKAHNAELLLVNVQQIVPVAFAVSLDINPEAPVIEKSRTASLALRELSEKLRRTHNITCNYEVDLTAQSISKTIAKTADKDTLFVMGTDGADDVMEELFGSQTFLVIKKTRNPLLLLPAEHKFNPVNRVLFVSTNGKDSLLPLSDLDEIVNVFNPQFTFLITEGNELFTRKKTEAEQFFGAEKASQITFWNRETEDLESTIRELIQQEKFDLVVMQEHDRNIIQRLFKTDPVKRIAAAAEFPVLILQSRQQD